jgi:hypothetical protein
MRRFAVSLREYGGCAPKNLLIALFSQVCHKTLIMVTPDEIAIS